MSILVYKQDGAWLEWHGDIHTAKMATTCVVTYADGRQVEQTCDPYPVPSVLNGDNVLRAYDNGIWTEDEVEAVGGRIAVPFVMPDGKQVAGLPRYEEMDGKIVQIYDVEDIPAPEPQPELTATEKIARLLSAYGISREEMLQEIAAGLKTDAA